MTTQERPPTGGRRALYIGLLFGAAIVGTTTLGTIAAAYDGAACREGDAAACTDAAYELALDISTSEALLAVGGVATAHAHHRSALQAAERASEQVTG